MPDRRLSAAPRLSVDRRVKVGACRRGMHWAALAWLTLASASILWAPSRDSARDDAAADLWPAAPAAGPRFAPRVPGQPPRRETCWVSDPQTPRVHAASVVATAEGPLAAVWYGGSGELQRDVRIFQSAYGLAERQWRKERPLLDAAAVRSGLQRHVKALGNPVLGVDRDGRWWLFFVSVSYGGWSGSSVNFCVSEDSGATWTSARKLILSPLLNLSYLVRGRVAPLADGRMGVPVYHELACKYCELSIVAADGRVVDKRRIGDGVGCLQPEIVAGREGQRIALLRSARPERRLLRSVSHDGGRSWTAAEATDLPNADSGFAVAQLDQDTWLAVYNDGEAARDSLALAESRDACRSWRRVGWLEPRQATPAGQPMRFEYPSIAIDAGGDIHVVYTWNRRRIRHQRFNRSWLASLPR